MDLKSAITETFKEILVPEFDKIKADIQELKSVQNVMNKRIDDMNGHLLDLSRRVDQVRTELNERIDATNNRIDATNERIESLSDTLNSRLDSLNNTVSNRIVATNERLDRLYDVIVRRDEHEDLKKKYQTLNTRIRRLEEKADVM